MRTSKRISQILLALFALLTLSISAMAADPGLTFPPTSEVSDQKAGSILFYNIYTSSAASSNSQNTRINITNTSTTSAAFVHLFFVAENCSVADSFICLTANQTASFLASDIDPGVNGYIVAVASDGVNGCPFSFNFLIGDEYVKFSTGHSGKLGAEAISALYNGVLPGCDANSTTATLAFNGTVGGYNQVPRVLAASSIGSRLDGDETLLIVNRVGGNLGIGASTLGTLFGLLYDDAEAAVSFQLSGSCQLRGVLGNSFPRVAGTFNGLIGQGRTGWMKIFSQSPTDIGILGATLTLNSAAGTHPGAFTGGSNMHKLRLSAANSYTIPIFAPGC